MGEHHEEKGPLSTGPHGPNHVLKSSDLRSVYLNTDMFHEKTRPVTQTEALHYCQSILDLSISRNPSLVIDTLRLCVRVHVCACPRVCVTSSNRPLSLFHQP